MNPLPQFQLTGKVALITGASKGIGEAMARIFAAHGAIVVINSRKQDELDKIRADEKGAIGKKHHRAGEGMPPSRLAS